MLSLGDWFGYLAFLFLAVSAAMMILRKQIIARFRDLAQIRRLHVAFSALAGLFIALHAAFFIQFPLDYGVVIGYVAAAGAVAVWMTGTAFLEQLRDSLFFHGTLSLVVLGLVAVHSAVTGFNLPVWVVDASLAGTVCVMAYATARQIAKAASGI